MLFAAVAVLASVRPRWRSDRSSIQAEAPA